MKSNLLRHAWLAFLALAALSPARAASDYATPYFFSTLAGTSSIGSQDGAGAAARFYSPRAVAVDSSGNAYIVDNGNHTIRKVTPAGVVSTLAGAPGIAGSADGTGAAARFDGPEDIVADAADNLYVTDTGNHTLRKITPAGMVTTFAGLAGVTGNQDGAGGVARFFIPRRIAIDATGNLYVTETGNGTIRKITPTGTVSTLARADFLATTTPSQLSYGAIAVDRAGNVYVSRHVISDTLTTAPAWADNYTYHGGAVTKYAPDGTATDLWTTLLKIYFDGRISNSSVSALTIDTGDQLVAASGYQVVRFAPQTAALTVLAGDGMLGGSDGAAGTAKFGFPLALAFDRSGTLFIADTGNNDLRKLSPAGAVTTVAGVALESAAGFAEGAGAAARFNTPGGTAVDAAGNVYVADTYNHVIRKITPAGVASTVAGAPGVAGSVDGTGTAARFNSPASVAVDSAGNVYVADTFNHTIRKVRPSGETSTLAGSAGSSGWDDGTGVAAKFSFPYGIAVDAAGNVYVTSAATVRKITPNGETSTLAGHASDTGSVDGTGANARFTVPYGIAVDAGGNLYVTEAPDSPALARVRKITPAGVVTTIAGADHGTTDGNGTGARFHDPYGVAVDATGNLFVADAFNQTIRKISPQGTVTTAAGLVDAPGSSDGTGRDARFYYPRGIAVDATGALYLASGTTIRKGLLATLPVISTQPASLSLTAGNGASFTVAAGGTPAPTYQWQRNGSPIAGATGSTFTLASAQSADAGDYTVIVTNALGSVTSAKATLTVTAAPAPPPPASSGGGGGGAPSAWFLSALAALGLGRCVRRARTG